jgi:hypothetical protein
MDRAQDKLQLFKQAGVGLIWGLFLVLAPMEILLGGALIWIPLFIWRERLRAARPGFWLGTALRYPIIAAIAVLAAIAPLKAEDQRVGPLPGVNVTLAQLAKARVIYDLFSAEHGDLRVQLPSASPTRREVMAVIKEQTGFESRIFHCGNGSTILFGGGVGRISVRDWPLVQQESHAN